MRVFVAVLVLIFSLQSWTKADDVSDFEIEGMSVGDSLLDYFSEKEIINKKNTYENRGYLFNHNDFYSLTFRYLAKFDKYDAIQVYLRDKDKKFIIQGLNGFKYYKNNIKDCYTNLKTVEKEFDLIFRNSTKVGDGKKREHVHDKSGESTTLDYYYYLSNNNYEFVSIVCSDWSNKINIIDNFQVQISSYDFGDFLFNKAYD